VKEATGIVLAGGKHKRLGINKPFLKLGRFFLVEIVVNKLREIFEKIIIVTNENNYFQMISLMNYSNNILVVRDKLENKGPLAGIYTGLLFVETPYIFVTGCDMPYLNSSLIKYMSKKIRGYDLVVPKKSEEYFEMLHTFYAKSCITVIEKLLSKNELSLRSMLPYLKVLYILPDEIKKFDPELLSFTNINTKDDLLKLNLKMKGENENGRKRFGKTCFYLKRI
jgi:molybdopterin-guanine dinucleotide biosynthesis protein A